ncbi:hypothetical protein [Serratia marcescens]|uniref:hypothetical protein n=1 Tax=Serratia marcescens TaxID=615 RepID=UPI0027E49EA5|nr:hypothetical protein [Serratia marcescens]MDH2270606.1 hypothetical protein [Serratia marcescens]MDH2278582.1 hypothetical protein [Serratia marcescens]
MISYDLSRRLKNKKEKRSARGEALKKGERLAPRKISPRCRTSFFIGIKTVSAFGGRARSR